MNGNRLSPSDYQIFLLKSLLWLALAWGGFISGLAGFFYAWAIWAGALVFAVVLFRQMLTHRINFRPSRELMLSAIISLCIASFFAFNSTPTVFTGRDQGAISEAAIKLSQNHSFVFQSDISNAFFKLHERGKALNFPGFYYTENGSLVSQFPLVYISWLALFFSVFGLSGFAIANAALLFIFLLAFYLLIRLFVDTFAAAPMMLFTVSSFLFMWFSKFTLSENMALPILWTSILSVLLFWRDQRKLFQTTFLITAFLLCYTRIEGFAFLFASLIVLSCNEDVRHYIKRKSFTRFFLPAFFFIAITAANTFIDINFYRELAKAMLPSITLPQAQYLGNLKHAALPDYYLGKVFYIYGMLGFFIFGAFSLIFFAVKKDYYKLIPFFITLPSFIYLLDSHITPDHPWMLRRFMFSLLPVAIFYSGLLVGQWLEEKKVTNHKYKILAFAVIFWLLIGNLPAFTSFLFYSDNQNLLSQTKNIADNFSDKDLVLIDQKTTGDGWSMISGPMNSLYGKNAVYFFNIADLNKLDFSSFENVYLIAPNEQVLYYLNSTIGKKLNFQKDYSLNFTQLDGEQNEQQQVNLPLKKQISVQGKIFKYNK